MPTSLAVFWGEELRRRVGDAARDGRESPIAIHGDAAPPPSSSCRRSPRRRDKLDARLRHVEDAVGRHQPLPAPHRRHRAAVQRRGAEHPGRLHVVALGLARVVRRARYPDTKKWYGTSGNSFVAVVEFGDSVRAKAVTAGGESGDPKSTHFNDQAERYATGNLRDVYFYPSQLKGHTERVYHPGN